MIKAIIFDNDGVLVDSQHLHVEVEAKSLSKYGITVTSKELLGYSGAKLHHMFEDLFRKHGVKTDPVEAARKHEVEGQLYVAQHAEPVNGALRLVEEAKKHYKVALASGAPDAYVTNVLKKLKLQDKFDFIMTGDDVKYAKPNPEIFVKAAQGLKVNPSECLVIEDAPQGIEAAKAAGMKCIGLLTAHRTRHELKAADLIVHNLNEININSLNGLRERNI